MTALTTSSFLFNDTPTTEIYTLSLHDALPIGVEHQQHLAHAGHALHTRARGEEIIERLPRADAEDRKSTRLNSSHTVISYAVFCLKKKKILDVILARRCYTVSRANRCSSTR